MASVSFESLEPFSAEVEKRMKKADAARVRLGELRSDLRITEPEAAAQYDLLTQWLPKIEKAMSKRVSRVDNYPWIWFSRADPPYVQALRELLGLEFQVTWKEGAWGNQYTEISW